MIRKTRVDDGGLQERWSAPLSAFCRLPLEVPDLQRPIDDDRVAAILDFQKKRVDEQGDALFVGDIATLAEDAQGRLWLVDGQHRLAAARQLVVCAPQTGGHRVTALVVRIGPTLPLADLFRLINHAVPVPAWIVDGTLTALQRSVLGDAERALKRRYGPFWSGALAPRRPNVSLAALMGALAAFSARFPGGAGDLVVLVENANERLRAENASSQATALALEKSGRTGAPALFLSNDPMFEWLHAARPVDPPPRAVKATLPRRRGLSKAARLAVWNRFFGERSGVGQCQCCRREVTQQTFECGHIVAAAAGGDDDPVNLRPVCGPCNKSMGAVHMDEFALGVATAQKLQSFCISVDD